MEIAKECDSQEMLNHEWEKLEKWVKTTDVLQNESYRHGIQEELKVIWGKA